MTNKTLTEARQIACSECQFVITIYEGQKKNGLIKPYLNILAMHREIVENLRQKALHHNKVHCTYAQSKD